MTNEKPRLTPSTSSAVPKCRICSYAIYYCATCAKWHHKLDVPRIVSPHEAALGKKEEHNGK